MNLNTLAEIIEIYMPAIIGAVAQIFFLLLPVDLKNWKDDDLNILTYIAVQIGVACVIFIGIPTVFELYSLGWKLELYLVTFVGILGWLRVTKLIPLEATAVSTLVPPKKTAIQFQDFNENQRLLLLSEVSMNSLDGQERYKKIKERIALRKPEKVDQLGGY